MAEDIAVRLVIVDDEYPIREMLRQSIDWKEHHIEVAGIVEDGEEAIELIKEYNPDLVLSDIRMPNIDGIELSRWISLNYPDIKVIFLTAYSDFEDAQKAIKYGVVDYLLKPLDPAQLFETIDKIRNEIKVKRKENDEIARLMGLSVNSGKSEIDRIYESMRSFKWQDVEQYVKEYFDNLVEESDAFQAYPYGAVFELLSVIKRLQDSSDAFPQYSISTDKIHELKKLKNVKSMYNAVIEIFNGYFGLMLKQKKSPGKSLIKEIKEYLSAHCSEVIILADICSVFFISPSNLSKLFKRECGMTFSDYLIMCRIEKAKTLLLSSDSKIYEISSSAGYNSEKHFIREFKRYVGMSPGKYREAAYRELTTV